VIRTVQQEAQLVPRLVILPQQVLEQVQAPVLQQALEQVQVQALPPLQELQQPLLRCNTS
jgi:hypothetical protein